MTPKHGRIYNGYAVTNSNFAPINWSVCTRSDFESLRTYLGGQTIAGDKMKEVGLEYWDSPNNSNNSSNFTAYGSGYRETNGSFWSFKLESYWWTITPKIDNPSQLYTSSIYQSQFYESVFTFNGGEYVRLIYTGIGTPPSTINDYDGNTYDVIQINTQYWLKQNWGCSKLNDGTLIPNITGNTEWSNMTTMACCAYNNDINNIFFTIFHINDFNIKRGLIINNTQPITGITDNHLLLNNPYEIPTVNSIKGYVEDKMVVTVLNNQVVFNNNGTLFGSEKLTFNQNGLNVSGNTKTQFGLYSIDGAMCIKMINKTGSPTVKGKLVTYYTSSGNSFQYFSKSGTITDPYIGIIMESGITDGNYTHIAIYGRCDILVHSQVFINTLLTTYNSINDGELLASDLFISGGYVASGYVARCLENGSTGDMVRCLLFNRDHQITNL